MNIVEMYLSEQTDVAVGRQFAGSGESSTCAGCGALWGCRSVAVDLPARYH
jgi:hypothetical protein